MYDSVNTGNITIILNKPKYSGNIGSTARCLKNMGIEKLYVVKSRLPDREAMQQMATHFAADILGNIRYFDTLQEAVADFHYIVGTTARMGSKSARQPVVEPREMASQLVDISKRNEIALVFGSEDRGLTNDELKYCHVLVNIPTSDRLTSINLSHAVMICCYEIFMNKRESAERFTPRLATSSELEAMYDHLKTTFITIDFINLDNPDYWMMYIRRFFSRIKLYSKEVKIIRGICRNIERYAGQQKT
ncbi:MAG: RNA methyltransferase [Deltaproteobacteria bacterium]|nr:RNA methyltransferase [Deltaproteobacteria bacterium]